LKPSGAYPEASGARPEASATFRQNVVGAVLARFEKRFSGNVLRREDGKDFNKFA
jgi:hypothetical protein